MSPSALAYAAAEYGGAEEEEEEAAVSWAKYERFQAWQARRTEGAEGRLDRSSRRILMAAQKEAWRQHGASLAQQRRQERSEAMGRLDERKQRMLVQAEEARREHAAIRERSAIQQRAWAHYGGELREETLEQRERAEQSRELAKAGRAHTGQQVRAGRAQWSTEKKGLDAAAKAQLQARVDRIRTASQQSAERGHAVYINSRVAPGGEDAQAYNRWLEDCEVDMAFRYKASGQAARQRAIEQRNFTERARKQLAERREIEGAKTRVQREHVAREHGLGRALWARERAEAAAQVRVHGTASREAAREVLGGLERMGWAFTAVSQL